LEEFRIGNDALKREAKFRMLSWGTVLLLVIVATFLFGLHVSGHISDSSSLGSLFVVTIVSAAILALILAPREGLHRAERKMVFALDDKRIVRKRQGYPDVEIAFSEVETLREELRWLVVTANEARRKIAVPRNVSGYELIRTVLAKHHPLSARVASSPWKGIAFLIASILSWAAVLWFRDVRAIVAAGTVVIITLGFGSYRVWILLHRSSKRPLLWAFLCITWLMALLLIYFRVIRP
jgi:hypothetical protein